MNDETAQSIGSGTESDLKPILIQSLVGTAGVMWVIGGFLGTLKLYDLHWALGWLGAFLWVWGCWAAALYFDLPRFFRT